MLGKLFLTAILATVPAFAQRGSGGGEPASAGTPIQQAQPVSKAVMLADRLKLNKEQRDKAQAILVEANKEITQLRSQITRDRAQIANLIISSGSQEEINKLMETYSAAAAQVTGIEVKAFTRICALLTPDQMSKAGSAFDLLAAVLDPPGTAARGGGGRGRQ
jgi:hypothetical protein